jgi:hypothetical protein
MFCYFVFAKYVDQYRLFVSLSVRPLAATIVKQSLWNDHSRPGLSSSWNSTNVVKISLQSRWSEMYKTTYWAIITFEPVKVETSYLKHNVPRGQPLQKLRGRIDVWRTFFSSRDQDTICFHGNECPIMKHRNFFLHLDEIK